MYRTVSVLLPMIILYFDIDEKTVWSRLFLLATPGGCLILYCPYMFIITVPLPHRASEVSNWLQPVKADGWQSVWSYNIKRYGLCCLLVLHKWNLTEEMLILIIPLLIEMWKCETAVIYLGPDVTKICFIAFILFIAVIPFFFPKKTSRFVMTGETTGETDNI